MNFKRSIPVITFAEFKVLVSTVKEFSSVPKARRYEIMKVDNDIVHFLRKDGNSSKRWSFDLNDVYKAYISLKDFHTSSFKKYVPIRHSPARGLLSHLKMIEPLWP